MSNMYDLGVPSEQLEKKRARMKTKKPSEKEIMKEYAAEFATQR